MKWNQCYPDLDAYDCSQPFSDELAGDAGVFHLTRLMYVCMYVICI